MKEKTVIIEIDEQGNSSIDLKGFQGTGCGDVATSLQGRDSVRNLRQKPEFYLQAAATKVQQERQ